ncbi:MAG: RNA 2',3'-cyclic phosphodiesterase [Betaproteobacteria bacterium]|jgi:2'-5' RNA ligase|nr:RNA 2',3'-cyclic phosphodiesterase [Betaproteobacteria bacterium]
MAAERRVFFALWPDDRIARLFEETGRRAGENLGGRRMRRETLHLTLAFIGGIASERLVDLQEIAGAIHLSPFELTFDRLQCLPRKKIAWASASASPSGVLELAAGLNAQLKAGGFHTEERPFATHVTLVRNATCEAGMAEESLSIVWSVRNFVLAESERRAEGAHYRILGCWPLDQT